jgi:DnaK suppressor protein
MKHLSNEQVAELRRLLEEKLKKLTTYHRTVVEESPAQDTERANNNESGEDAQEAYELLASEALSGETAAMVQEVKDALQRMKDGTYGIDVNTGETIPYLRLKLYPEARSNAADAEAMVADNNG